MYQICHIKYKAIEQAQIIIIIIIVIQRLLYSAFTIVPNHTIKTCIVNCLYNWEYYLQMICSKIIQGYLFSSTKYASFNITDYLKYLKCMILATGWCMSCYIFILLTALCSYFDNKMYNANQTICTYIVFIISGITVRILLQIIYYIYLGSMGC